MVEQLGFLVSLASSILVRMSLALRVRGLDSPKKTSSFLHLHKHQLIRAILSSDLISSSHLELFFILLQSNSFIQREKNTILWFMGRNNIQNSHAQTQSLRTCIVSSLGLLHLWLAAKVVKPIRHREKFGINRSWAMTHMHSLTHWCTLKLQFNIHPS